MSVTRARVVVNGRVQGVWFRESTRRMATGLGVHGWVRNLVDGSVEAVFEGSAEQVREAVSWSHTGPPSAVVTSVSEFAEQPEGLVGFEVR